MTWRTSRLRAAAFAVRAYWTARRKQHGAGPAGHTVGVMMAASYYAAIRQRPSRYWQRKMMTTHCDRFTALNKTQLRKE